MDQLDEALARSRHADRVAAVRPHRAPVPGSERRFRAARTRRPDEL